MAVPFFCIFTENRCKNSVQERSKIAVVLVALGKAVRASGGMPSQQGALMFSVSVNQAAAPVPR